MMQERILDILKKKTTHVATEQLCQQAGVSRTALWQAMSDLRRAGYVIETAPHLGYKLLSAPDRLLPYELTHGLHTKTIGRQVYYSERCASTMDIALQLAESGAPEGTLVVTETQDRGRGRLGRSWVSQKFKGIYLSLILRPEVDVSRAQFLTLVAAAAVCEAVKRCTGIQAGIKWPNDIIVRDKKAGGILTELKAELDRVKVMVIGIGLNVNASPEELKAEAVSLKAASARAEKLDRVRLTQEILRAFETQYQLFQRKGPDAVLESWKKHSLTLGRRVKIAAGRAHVEGVAVDIDADGGLLVRRDSGIIQKFMAGDVLQLR